MIQEFIKCDIVRFKIGLKEHKGVILTHNDLTILIHDFTFFRSFLADFCFIEQKDIPESCFTDYCKNLFIKFKVCIGIGSKSTNIEIEGKLLEFLECFMVEYFAMSNPNNDLPF